MSFTLDVGKRNGNSAYKRQQPNLKKVLRCYTSDNHVKPRVISSAAVDLNRLVDCLRQFGKGWQEKVKEDFSIEYATFVQEFSDEKLNATRPMATDPQEDEDEPTVDPEEVARNFFDVGKVMGEDELGQAAKVLQETFNLREAPSIDLLQSVRDWQRQTGLPEQSGPQHSTIIDLISRSPSPEPATQDR
jgi:hypothetical protein